jgi:hypothetical protein
VLVYTTCMRTDVGAWGGHHQEKFINFSKIDKLFSAIVAPKTMLVVNGQQHEMMLPMDIIYGRIGYFGRVLLFFSLLNILFMPTQSSSKDDDEVSERIKNGFTGFIVIAIIGIVLQIILATLLINSSNQKTKESLTRAVILAYLNMINAGLVKFIFYFYFTYKYKVSGYFSWIIGAIIEVWLYSMVLKLLKTALELIDNPTLNLDNLADALGRAAAQYNNNSSSNNNNNNIGGYNAPQAHAQFAQPAASTGPPIAYANAEIYPVSGYGMNTSSNVSVNMPTAQATQVKGAGSSGWDDRIV